MPSLERYRFGKFTLDAANEVLTRSGKPVALRPQSFAVLVHLARHAEQWTTLNDLVGTVFPSQTANANSYAQCIADIRKALGEPAMIRGVQRRGYMLAVPATLENREAHDPKAVTADVEQEQRANDAPVDLTSPQHPAIDAPPSVGTTAQVIAVLAQRLPIWASPRGISLAAGILVVGLLAVFVGVLRREVRSAPFVLTMAAEPSVAIAAPTPRGSGLVEVAQAFADELSTELVRTSKGFDLLIMSSARKTAKELASARYIVQSALSEDRGFRKYTVQLLEAPTGRQIWAEAFKTPAADAAAQTLDAVRIARVLVVQIRTAETQRPLPAVPVAGHYVLQGRALLENGRGPEARLQIKSLFDKAIALDPNHIQGLTGYARIRIAIVLGGVSDPDRRQQLLAEAATAIDRILHSDPRAAFAYHLRGALARANDDQDRAKAAFERALEINPHYAFSHGELARVYVDTGAPREALFHVERALALSPTDPTASFWYFWAGMASADLGDYPASAQWLLKALQSNPDKKEPLTWLAICYARMGRQYDAYKVIREYLETDAKLTVARWRNGFALRDPKANAHRQSLGDSLRELGIPDK